MRVVILSGALVLCGGLAPAQEQPKLHFLLNGGVALPSAPDEFKEVWRTGVNLGGGVGYRFSRRFSLQARIHYDQFPVSEKGLMDLASEETGFDPRFFGFSLKIQGADVSVFTVSAEVKASLVEDPEKISPYAFGGLGAAHYSSEDSIFSVSFLGRDMVLETIEGESETAVCAVFGGGIDVPLAGRFGLFVEGRYQVGFTEDEATHHGTLGAGLRIGVR